VRRFRATLEYDGTEFSGWQLQPDARTVQGELETALARVTGASARPTAASRTDAGVHARGQVAHFDSQTRLSPTEIRSALNAELPRDVAVLEVREVPADYHARHHAVGKRYVYRILTRGSPSPLRRRFVWHLRQRLDLPAMQAAAAALIGSHDFAAFRGIPGGAPTEDTQRTLERLEWLRDDDELVLVAEARSFLRHMVRNVVGTLVDVGAGRLAAASMPAILASRDRSRAGPTAPPHGLCLDRVFQPELPGDPA
jgi:tRNA pseudouridine38-40 synthase